MPLSSERSDAEARARGRTDRREPALTAPVLTVVWDARFRAYDFGSGHPFSEITRGFAVRLFESSLTPAEHRRVAWERDIEPAPPASLLAFHDDAYLEEIRTASHAGHRRPLDGGDTLSFPGCFEESARIVSGTELAVRRALEEHRIAFAPAGGLHHARRDGASGFCIFNDLGVAIAGAVGAGRRVAYVDLDVHHGDGVMYGFYDSGRVLDIDFHQDGRTLFPGTGHITETGAGDGAGLKVNVPLPPGAGDDALVPLAHRLLPPLLREFRPDLLVVQHGVDGHWGDPLAQLQYTPDGYLAVDRLLLELAHELGAPVVVTGGGGYRPSSVSRVLARVGLLLGGFDVPPDGSGLPKAWKEEYLEAFGPPAPSRWADPPVLRGSSWGAAQEERLVRSLEQALDRRFPSP